MEIKKTEFHQEISGEEGNFIKEGVDFRPKNTERKRVADVAHLWKSIIDSCVKRKENCIQKDRLEEERRGII